MTPDTRGNRARRVELGCGLLLLLLICTAATIGPGAWHQDPLRQELAANLAKPSVTHPLGQDRLGRDVLARVLHGARISLVVGAASVTGALVLGVILGVLAGYGRTWMDELIMRLTDILLAFPGLLLAIALAAVLGPSERNIVIALTVMGWPGYARLVRAEVRSAAAREYVAAAEALGAHPVRVAFQHLVPTARPALVVQATFGMAGAILAEASLSFLGLGSPPPAPSWGAMLAEGRAFLLRAPHLTVGPGVAIALTVLAINLIADALSERPK